MWLSIGGNTHLCLWYYTACGLAVLGSLECLGGCKVVASLSADIAKVPGSKELLMV